jgi:hypothetical protein
LANGANDGEAHLRALAESTPNATGFFMDSSGLLVVALGKNATAKEESSALAWLSGQIESAGIRSPDGGTARFRISRDASTRFSLASLLAWRDRLLPEVLLLQGLSNVDMNEQDGVITIAVDGEALREPVEKIVKSLQIPSSAVRIEFSTVSLNYPIPSTLLARSRPLGGGVLIGPDNCTSGIAALTPGGTPMMMTAGHCSPNRGVTDFNWITQGSSSLISYEFFDYSYSCSTGQCDHADVGYYTTDLIDFDSGIGELPYELGLIWRTDGRVAGPSATGSLNVDQTFPRLTVTSIQTYAVMNQVVDAVGRRDGWSFGSTYRTCTSVPYPAGMPAGNYRVHCLDFARYTTRPGDSGAPIFIHYPSIPASEGGNGVAFLGINAGDETAANGTKLGGFFSNSNQIRNEIGLFRFW